MPGIDLPIMAPTGPQMPKTAPSPVSDKMRATAQEFEATFLSQFAKLMLESVEIDQDFGGGHGEEMFRGVLSEKLGGQMAARGGIGLAPSILHQMIRMQGGTH